MREIKFRAWHKDGEMFYKVPLNSVGQHARYGEDATLMQYTGLHDKNGKEIYEGDIVNILPNYVLPDGVVVWDEDFAGFVVKHPRYEDFCELDCIHNVVTNIYENPDLLEVK